MTYFIFDLDGTIVNLKVDWIRYKTFVKEKLKTHRINSVDSLTENLRLLGKLEDKRRIIRKFEIPDGWVTFTKITPTFLFMEELERFSVISNNLTETAEQVLKKTMLFEKCDKIIGIDKLIRGKPSLEAFEILKKHVNLEHYKKIVFFGDRVSDQTFAEKLGLKFVHVKQLESIVKNSHRIDWKRKIDFLK